jgi:hypothetical protein
MVEDDTKDAQAYQQPPAPSPHLRSLRDKLVGT